MRIKSLAIAAALGSLATIGFASGSANAAPAAPARTQAAVVGQQQQPELLPVRDSCGRGFYLARWQDRWGRWHARCQPMHGRRGPDRWDRGPWSGGGGGSYWGHGWGGPGWGYHR